MKTKLKIRIFEFIRRFTTQHELLSVLSISLLGGRVLIYISIAYVYFTLGLSYLIIPVLMLLALDLYASYSIISTLYTGLSKDKND